MVDGVVSGVGVPVGVGGVEGVVEGVLLGPGSGGGVVPALPEFHQSGAGVFDSGMECVRVLPGSVARATGGEGLHSPGILLVGEGHGSAVERPGSREALFLVKGRDSRRRSAAKGSLAGGRIGRKVLLGVLSRGHEITSGGRPA